MSLLMCHGDSPQQQALRGMSWEEYFTKPEVSECQLLQFFHLYNGETHRDPTAEAGAIPEAENWSCGEPFPASKLTLLKTEQLIIHTYTHQWFTSAQPTAFCLGWGHCLKPCCPALWTGQTASTFPFAWRWTPAVTDFSRAYLSPFSGFYEGSSILFPVKYQIVNRTTCFVWAQNVSSVKATKCIHKYLGTSAPVIPVDFKFIYTVMGRDVQLLLYRLEDQTLEASLKTFPPLLQAQKLRHRNLTWIIVKHRFCWGKKIPSS